MPDDTILLAALGEVRRRGAIGTTTIADAVTHAEQFVHALPASTRRVADLGSGGGLPALVIAVRRPELQIVLVERRTARADMLRRAVLALGVGERVTVVAEDVRALAARQAGSFDAVTARSFASPAVTAKWGCELLRVGGLLIVSEPPEEVAERWQGSLLERLGLEDLGRELGVRVLRRR
jgi:16S rRNA (guanine527-N7)-methyltransferase